MYKIGDMEFLNNNKEDLYEEIKVYLHEKQFIINDESGAPLSEKAFMEIIASHSSYSFSVKQISTIEKEFIEELVIYIEKVKDKVDSFSKSNDKELIINGFINLINSLIEIQATAGYFEIEIIDIEYINELATRAISRIEDGDYDFLVDVMEYELVPSLVHFKNKLPERLY
ncbi:hypothetical protein [Terribacillus sp. DMT04]|uniref:hypothetical protein n=1 Tax=Terribacillus sp. DMT04 TaxID=2850441 RepID=UPI001C2BD855|nr:hypothetical protein [Terribacillus sp. DMT04]QXE00959.1 hypothetical protein KS242_13255 [Terribacillus sp. DMT04]